MEAGDLINVAFIPFFFVDCILYDVHMYEPGWWRLVNLVLFGIVIFWIKLDKMKNNNLESVEQEQEQEQEQEGRVVAEYERLKALGTGKFKVKKYEEASKYYDAAADEIYSADGDSSPDPTRLSYYVVCKSNAAQCCINLNDFEGAIGYASSAILKDPTNAKALYRRGTSFMATTRFDSAIDDLRSCIALTLDPSTKRDVEKELKSAVNKCLNDSIIAGDLEKTKSLLEEGSDFNYRNQKIDSFLMLASRHGHLSIVELLLSKGANIYDKTTTGYSSLMLASMQGHFNIKGFLEKWFVIMMLIVLQELLQGDLSNIDYPDFFINLKQYI